MDILPLMAYRRLPQYDIGSKSVKAVDPTNIWEDDDAWEIVGGEGKTDDRNDVLRRKVGLVHRCIDIRRNSIVTVPWQIENASGEAIWSNVGDDERVPAALKGFERWPTLLSLTEAALCIGSQAYWQIDGAAAPKWLAPPTMTPEWDVNSGLGGFTRRLGARRIPMPVEDVLYIWRQDPMHETAPAPPPLEAAAAAAGVGYGRDVFAAKYFSRGAIKATILAVAGNAPQTERDKLESWFNRFLSGVSGAFRTKVLNMDAITPVVLGEGLEALADAGLDESIANGITIALGVPLTMLQGDAANYATAGVNLSGFWKHTILPDCDLIADAVNTALLEPLGYHLRFMPNQMDIFQEDEAQRAGAVVQYTQAILMALQAGAPQALDVAFSLLGVDVPAETRKLMDELYLATPAPAPAPALPAASALDVASAETPDAEDVPEAVKARPVGWEEEAGQFRRWLHNRNGKAVDLSKFTTHLLTYLDMLDIVETENGNTSTVYDWRNY